MSATRPEPAGPAAVYARFGVRTIINAAGPQTRLSGGLIDPAVAAAMASAAGACVDMAELQAAASEVIARVTGAEAGCVTAGGAAALMLGAAACMTGLDVARMNRLPDTTDMRDEFVMSRSQRNMYDRAIRQAGGRLVEVGIPDRFTGAGVRDAEPWHFEAVLGPRSAAILYFAQRNSEPRIEQLSALAQKHGVPLLVDAASQLPPRENLRRFFDLGADLVAVSGGKAIGGPQGSGLLAGRADLVLSAVLQMLDHDVFPELFRPVGRLFERLSLPVLPDHGIGRPAKAGKEQIVGVLAALELYVQQDERAVSNGWRRACEEIVAAFESAEHVTVAVREDPRRPGAFFVEATITETALGQSALQIAGILQDGDPSVRANLSRVRDGILLFSPMCLRSGEASIVGRALNASLSAVA
jgi:L-seryl-tRNA(Ser) seleniumtransferase